MLIFPVISLPAVLNSTPLALGGVTGGLSDGGVRPEMGLGSGGCRGAEPPAIGPRSGKFLRFETLEGHFLAKIKVHAP